MNLFDQFETTLSASSATLSNVEAGAPIQTQEEREREWLERRWGKFTASEIYKLMTYPDKDGLPAGAMTYVLKKAAESLTEFSVTPFISDAMQWGLLHEPEAIDAFQSKTGLVVSHHNDRQEFIDGGHFGGTPGGLILSEFSGLEIKCPNSETHIGYRAIRCGNDLKAEAPQYYWQCHCLMLLTQSSHWYFVSYDPRFRDERLRLHIARIDRVNADIVKLRERLAVADLYKTKIIEGLQ